jgi:hypothetical protein
VSVSDVLGEAFDLYRRIGGVVAHSITTPFIALVGAVLYFRLARLSVGVDPAPATAS